MMMVVVVMMVGVQMVMAMTAVDTVMVGGSGQDKEGRGFRD